MADDAAAAKKPPTRASTAAKAAASKAPAKDVEPEVENAAARRKLEEPAPTTGEARESFAKLQEDPPDPLEMHVEKSLAASDQQGADAIRAAYEYESTDLSHLAYQVEQFDSSGNNVLTAMAFPSKAALRSSKKVEDRQGITAARQKREREDRAAAAKKAPATDKK